MEAPDPLAVALIPSVNVPVCVVSRCVFTCVAKCVLQRTHSGGDRLCVRKSACVGEIASVSKKVCVTETPCVKETPCVSGVVASVPKCVPSSTPCMKETLCVWKKHHVWKKPRV